MLKLIIKKRHCGKNLNTNTNNISMGKNTTNINKKLQRILKQSKMQHELEEVENTKSRKPSTFNPNIKL